MAKFYQHMQPGETLGKITKLKYIDDISDDELIIYVFADNSKCSETYIAEINSKDAFNGNYVMVELTDPLNDWKFEAKEINLTKTHKVIADDGQEYEIPEPGVGINGEHMSVSISESGDARTVTNNSLAGKRTNAIPPIVKNVKVEPKENYLLSLHPELLDDKKNQEKDLSHSFTQINKSVKSGIDEQRENIKQNNNIKLESPVKTSVIETVKQASITINIKDILAENIYNKVNIITNNDNIEISIDDFINRLLSKPNIEKKQEDLSIYENNVQEDILIKNMIDKSKKIPCTIGVDITLELPPKEVYSTIRDVYPEGMSHDFVNSIARRMNINELKKSLAEGLISYYEADNEKQQDK